MDDPRFVWGFCSFGLFLHYVRVQSPRDLRLACLFSPPLMAGPSTLPIAWQFSTQRVVEIEVCIGASVALTSQQGNSLGDVSLSRFGSYWLTLWYPAAGSGFASLVRLQGDIT